MKVSSGPDHTPPGLADSDSLGSRVARARQEAGLSQKELANRLGLPLWRVDRLQRGHEDPRSHLPGIAEATGKPPEWFLAGQEERTEEIRNDTAAGRPALQVRAAARDLSKRLGRLARARSPSKGSPADSSPRSGPEVGAPRRGQPSAADDVIAARIARARQEAGLSQKELGTVLDVPLWRIERMERGDENPAEKLRAIAALTGRSEGWFIQPADGANGDSASRDSGGVATTDAAPIPGADVTAGEAESDRLPRPFRRNIILAAITLLVTIRFFIEIVHILPKAARLVDIPILLLLGGAAFAVQSPRSQGKRGLGYILPIVIFLVIASLSILSNLGRVASGPTLLFLYGFLAPLGVYYAVYRLWPAGQVFSLSRLLVGLAALQFFVVAVIDLPRFLASHNPDVVSGTFGENAYQLVWFLMVAAAVVAGAYTFERKRLAARMAPFFFVATLATIFLAQYRQLLITLGATVLLIAALLGFIRLRGAIAAVLIALTFVLSLSYLSSAFPVLKYSSTVSTLASDPGLYVTKRLAVAEDVGRLYTDNPRYIVTGTGPGTYSSRAWYVFSDVGVRSRTSLGLQSSRGYQSDVANKYVVPRLARGKAEAVGGSYAITTPLSSYLSLLGEVGIFGFLAIMLIYGGAFLHVLRMTIRSLRWKVEDPLPGLLLGCTVGFFVLLQMAVFENWFEVTRLTFILWALLAVVTKEFSARNDRRVPHGAPAETSRR